MALLQIYQDSRGQGRCRSCGANVEWAELTSGKRMPFDGEIVVVKTQGSLLGGERIVEFVDTAVTPTHWETCTDPERWRKKR